MGDRDRLSPEVIQAMNKKGLRLFFVTEDEEAEFHTRKILNELNLRAEVDFTRCAKEGCWEADIILLCDPLRSMSNYLPKIREVSIQKPVLIVEQISEKEMLQDVQKLLPNSMVFVMDIRPKDKRVFLIGRHSEAKAEIYELLGS